MIISKHARTNNKHIIPIPSITAIISHSDQSPIFQLCFIFSEMQVAVAVALTCKYKPLPQIHMLFTFLKSRLGLERVLRVSGKCVEDIKKLFGRCMSEECL